MKKFILCIVVTVLLSFSGFSQNSAIEGSVEYQKGDKRAAIIELPYPPEIVEGTIKKSMERTGIKEEKLKGMQVFKGARLSPTDGEAADLYFKVDKKGRKEANISIVYLILGRPNENVALRTADDAYRIQDGKSFLNGLTPSLESFQLEVNIAKQEDEIKKSEKKLRNLEDDQRDLEKKIQNLQEKLARNKKDQEAMSTVIVNQRTVKDTLNSRRVTAE